LGVRHQVRHILPHWFSAAGVFDRTNTPIPGKHTFQIRVPSDTPIKQVEIALEVDICDP
jgi:hypothetical protein